jgi:plastocyanin
MTLGLLAGCGGDGDKGGGATTPAPTETPAQPAGKVVHVRMKNIKFVPRSISVKAGTKVVWQNDDSVVHTVTKDNGPGAEFDSDQVAPGAKFEQTFAAPGKVSYVCTIHPNQDGTITVK